MSNSNSPLIIDWAPTSVKLFDPITQQTTTGGSIREVVDRIGSHREAIVAVSRRNAFVRAIRVPNAGRPEVAQALTMLVGQHFPVIASDLAYDFRLGPPAEDGGRWAIVGGVRLDSLRKLFTDAQAAGIKIKAVTASAFGSWNLAKSMNLTDAVVMEITDEGLAVDVIVDGELRHSRVVPIPNTETGPAEELSRTLAMAEVSQTTVVGASGLDYSILDQKTQTKTLESFATSGEVLNIEPPEFVIARKLKIQRQAAAQRIAVSAVALAIAGFIFFQRTGQAAAASAEEAKWQRIMQKEKSALGTARTEVTKAEKRITSLDRAFSPAQRLTDVITVISNRRPDNIWLTSLKVERGKPIQLRGMSKDEVAVGLYAGNLSPDATGMRLRNAHIDFANASKIEETSIVNFSMSAHAVGNLPLEDKDAKVKASK